MALPSRVEVRLNATRRSLLSRVRNPDDQESWKDFFDTYSRLVYSVAQRTGLNHVECEEVVQETFIALSRKLPEFRYDPKVGSFKSWLIHTTQFKVQDQFRKKKRGRIHQTSTTPTEGRTATIERVADPASLEVDSLFEDEWREHLFRKAVERMKQRVPEGQFQIFDLYVMKKWPVRKVAETLSISSGRVYLTKHRLANLVKLEIKALQTDSRR